MNKSKRAQIEAERQENAKDLKTWLDAGRAEREAQQAESWRQQVERWQQHRITPEVALGLAEIEMRMQENLSSNSTAALAWIKRHVEQQEKLDTDWIEALTRKGMT